MYILYFWEEGDTTLKNMDQHRTPLFDAVRKYVSDETVPFHVPGHKQGRGLEEFRDFVGGNVLAIDITCFDGTDNICNPLDVIKQAQELAAEAYGADHAFFLVNGTTSGIQGMIMSVCQPGDKIIIPRNAHKSAIGGIILSGAEPVYIQPEINRQYGVTMGVTPETVAQTIKENPDVKALFLINPTYYGFAPDLERIVEIAHNHGIPVLVDEAHGAHLPFIEGLPKSAMACGADMSAISIHKLGGSLTQSSILVLKEGLVEAKRVKSVLNLMQTTSPSYILLASIDVARKQMATRGKELLETTLQLADYARTELGKINGLTVIGSEVVGHPGCMEWDPSKVSVDVRGLGLSGFEVEVILRKKYQIQVELADMYNVLLLFSIGDQPNMVEHLLNAFRDISEQYDCRNVVKLSFDMPSTPELVVSPQEAFYSDTRSVPFVDAEDEICAEMIMAYPPGVPIICPGERITKEIIDYIQVLKNEHCHLQGPEDPMINQIKVLTRHLVLVQPQTKVGMK